MSAIFKWLSALALLTGLIGCGQQAPSILSDISGVWRANDSTLVTFIYEDKKMRMLVGEDAMPVTLGAIDQTNHTVNLNLSLRNGKPGVWTVRQLWNADKTSFSLQITLDDGSQDQLAFIRKISADDLNKIANAEARNRVASPGSIAAAVPAPAPTPAFVPQATTPVAAPTMPAASAIAVAIQPASPPPVSQEPATMFAPSFDCNKASTGPERLICSNRELADADVKMAQAYRAASNTSADKDALKAAQASWRKEQRDACSDVTCMLGAYQNRLRELSR